MESKIGFVTTTDDARLGVFCIICGESAELTKNEELAVLWGHAPTKVCNECKKAILRMRRKYDNSENDE